LRPSLAKNTHRIDLQDLIGPKRDGSHGRDVEIAAWPIQCGQEGSELPRFPTAGGCAQRRAKNETPACEN
jgi:hypothetical protein